MLVAEPMADEVVTEEDGEEENEDDDGDEEESSLWRGIEKKTALA